MKKFLILVLAAITLFSLSGCIEVIEGVPQEEYDALKEKYDAVASERDTLLNVAPLETDANKESASCEHLSHETTIKEATCIEDGIETFTCLSCGYSHTKKIIGTHKWISATCATAKTCSVCQTIDGEPLGHQKENGKCNRCGTLITSMLYEDEIIKVTYRQAEKKETMVDAVQVFLHIENKTDETLIIQANVFSLNGYSFSNLISSDYILRNTIGQASVIILEFDFDAVDINNVFSVGAQLEVLTESFDRKATVEFNNVQVS